MLARVIVAAVVLGVAVFGKISGNSWLYFVAVLIALVAVALLPPIARRK